MYVDRTRAEADALHCVSESEAPSCTLSSLTSPSLSSLSERTDSAVLGTLPPPDTSAGVCRVGVCKLLEGVLTLLRTSEYDLYQLHCAASEAAVSLQAMRLHVGECAQHLAPSCAARRISHTGEGCARSAITPLPQ
ncbi:hypothetical protein NESM_000516300 [Novymonas esmeraldas]|uniref:Uncharacterized protein n=1 Tax=Novymonas esmeraldas TaxID=1808958 RepID=A0AAW0EQ53_9TRYP